MGDGRDGPQDPGRPAIAGPAAVVGAALAIVAAPADTSAQTGDSAADPLVTDRPDATESASAVAPGRFQLEGGYSLTHSGSFTLHSLGEALLRVGVLEGAELRLGLNSYRIGADGGSDPAGLADASVGTKVVFRDDARGAAPRLAILADATLPTGSDAFGADGVQPGGLMAASWDLSSTVGLGANAGYRYADSEEGRYDEIRTSVALGVGLADGVGVFLEYFGDHRPSETRPSEISADGGVTVLLSPDVQLDARAGVGLNAAAADYFLGAGVSVRR